jgi:UDP-glucuronate 4-epimerase
MLKGEKILITGLTGNLGGTIAEQLAKDNEVWGLARYTRAGQREYWEKAGVKTVVGDFAKNQLDGVPKDCKYVLHIAANTAFSVPYEQSMEDNADGVAFLMSHCRTAKAFLHVSTVGVYARGPSPDYRFKEDDPVGSGTLGQYTGTKIAGEGVAHAMSRLLSLPTIIARMAVQYGTYKDGGMPAIFLKMILQGKPIPMSSIWPNAHSLISNDDCVRSIEPFLNAAAVPAVTVNWGGDVVVPSKELLDYLSELSGVPYKTVTVDSPNMAGFPIDPTKRQAITGPCQVEWRAGIKKLYEALHEKLRAAPAAASSNW